MEFKPSTTFSAIVDRQLDGEACSAKVVMIYARPSVHPFLSRPHAGSLDFTSRPLVGRITRRSWLLVLLVATFVDARSVFGSRFPPHHLCSSLVFHDWDLTLRGGRIVTPSSIANTFRTSERLTMSNLIHTVVNHYNEMFEMKKEVNIDSWPMMGSPGPMLCIVGTYLAFVLKVGPKMMEKRPAFQLNSLLIAYNAFQVVFSVWITILASKPGIGFLMSAPKCNNPSREAIDLELEAQVTRGAWWYFIAKIIELLDTVFFVLRKKQNQVTFLHVYHHTITSVFSWCYLKFLPGAQGALLGSLNSFVHIVMYSYYLIAALGPQYRKYLWWKKYMTWMQLLQFGIMFVYLMMTLAMDCKVPKALTYFFLTNVVIFIYLFSDFYRKAYSKKKEV